MAEISMGWAGVANRPQWLWQVQEGKKTHRPRGEISPVGRQFEWGAFNRRRVGGNELEARRPSSGGCLDRINVILSKNIQIGPSSHREMLGEVAFECGH